MENRGFETEQIMSETPDTLYASERPLKSKESKPPRVDINILRSKLQKNEDKQFKKNLEWVLLEVKNFQKSEYSEKLRKILDKSGNLKST